VRDVLRRRDDLRDEYAAVKLSLAADPGMDMARYIAAKSEVVQKILLESDLTDEERLQILRLNDPARFLRPMTISDVSTVIEVQEPGAVRSLSAVFPQDEYPFPQDEVAARWLQELEHPTIECFVVVVDDDAVVGFAAIRHDEFLHFGIAVERWGTGLAQWAHDAVLDRMRERGIERACLRVFTGNGRGRRFYEKLGWQATGTRTRSTFPPNPELLHYERVIDLQVT
jgi:RimJ/RimL family protein N-acetyltransferase